MELLGEIEMELERLKKESKKDQKNLKTIVKRLKGRSPEQLIEACEMEIYNRFHYKKSEAMERDYFFKNFFGKTTLEEILNLSTEDKKEVKRILHEMIQKASLENFTTDYYYKIHTYRERLRMITQGVDCADRYFLSKEEEETLKNKFKEMAYLIIDHRFFGEKMDLMKKIYTFRVKRHLYEKSLSPVFHAKYDLKLLFHSESLREGANSLEEYEEMKKLAKQLYENNKFPLYTKEDDYAEVRGHFYLMTEEEIKEIKPSLEENLQMRYDFYLSKEKKEKKRYVSYLQQLVDDIKELENI